MDDAANVLAMIFKIGVYAIWGGAVIFGFYYFFAIWFAILCNVGFFMGLITSVFAIFILAPILLTLIAMFKS